MGPSTGIAKLAPPRADGVVRRERLNALFALSRQRPIVWVAGPPGAGKTMAVADYLAAIEAPTLWYRVDPGDADPATFFYFLRQCAAAMIAGEQRPLPLLTPEYLSDIPGFARRWFREAFLQLPSGTVLVLDNFQDAGDGVTLHLALVAAFEELPPGANVIVVSRRDPPSAFARAVVNGAIAPVGWNDLRLSAEEAVAVAASRGQHNPDVIRDAQERSNGWMAGVVLMTERETVGRTSRESTQADSLETVFDYFAGLVFDAVPPDVQDVLVRSALLPSVTTHLAEALVGHSNAIDAIDYLCRRNLFVDRTASSIATYRFHPLFHAFLRARARELLSESDRSELAAKGASALEAIGGWEEAYGLYAEAQRWTEVERLLLTHARGLIDQGRWRTLDEWIQRVPLAARERNPWFEYWRGRARIMISTEDAQPMLERAYARFLVVGDTVGQMLSAVSVIEALYLKYDDFAAMDPWHARITALLDSGVVPPSPDDELRTNAAVMVACSYRFIDYERLEDCVARVEALLSAPIDPNLRISAAGMLHAHVMTSLDTRIDGLAQRAARELITEWPQITAYRRAHYLAMEGYTHYVMGRFDRACEVLGCAEEITNEHRLDELGYLVACWRALSELRALRPDAAVAAMERGSRCRPPRMGPTPVLGRMVACGIAFAQGRTGSVLADMKTVQDHFEKTGQYVGFVPVSWFGAHIALCLGDTAAAEAFLERISHLLECPSARFMIGSQHLLQAWLEHQRGHPDSRDRLLEDVMRRARDGRSRIRYRWYPGALAALLPIVIERRIDVPAAIEIVRDCKVPAPVLGTEHWPWPVKIFTLGRFDLLVDGRPAEFSRKAPRRLLELLKAIVAFGADGVDERRLADALWPDDDGDNGVHTLHVSVTRLRKLLGCTEAVRVEDGKVSLDPTRCWVDALAFERTLRATEVDVEQLEQICGRYGGTFLGNDAEQPWLLPMRERLRTGFVERIERLGAVLESSAQWGRAAAWYQRGIDADPLIEAFHQGLMRCYLESGRRAEAMSAYRRLRQTLSVVLGIGPSSSTEALLQVLYTSETDRQSVANS